MLRMVGDLRPVLDQREGPEAILMDWHLSTLGRVASSLGARM